MTDSQSASLSWCWAPSGAQNQIFVTVRQLRVCWCGVPFLMRGWVCRLWLPLALTSAVILGSGSRGPHDHILLSQIWDSPNLEGQDPVFISPRKRIAQLYPQALDSLFVAFYDSQVYGGGIRTLLHMDKWWHSKQAMVLFREYSLLCNGRYPSCDCSNSYACNNRGIVVGGSVNR
jgi:hypothetical protein